MVRRDHCQSRVERRRRCCGGDKVPGAEERRGGLGRGGGETEDEAPPWRADLFQ